MDFSGVPQRTHLDDLSEISPLNHEGVLAQCRQGYESKLIRLPLQLCICLLHVRRTLAYSFWISPSHCWVRAVPGSSWRVMIWHSMRYIEIGSNKDELMNNKRTGEQAAQ